MEVIFDCFFEETFLRLERSGLKTKQKRKDVIDHLTAIILGTSKGQNVTATETCTLAVISAINYHQRKKCENNNVCLMGKFHNVLYIGLKIAWDWGVTDSDVVKTLLYEIFQCEQNFERLFLGAIFGSNAPYFIAGWRSDFLDQDENIRALVFYLEHAKNARLEFPVYLNKYEGTKVLRFIDVPIESCGKASPMRVALQASSPDLLLTLLRYGANSNPKDGGMMPIIAILDKLVEAPSTQIHVETCLKILLKTVPAIEMPYKPFTFEHRKGIFIEKYEILFERGCIKQQQVFGVMDLKHLCRCTIRENLRTNYQLPSGINMLKVPKSLKCYIDLMD
ncbi:uncharacterized protein LOC116345971 isoform X2 [Contarinia nasturtii]|uniref:uncharacterized protein LOC116345971 isoform X2 n=1 Tax=Contarinia nasturtii TaxID=265458 RepID=UPI0012D49BC4|nr:uncharacterized protein LOC116345971 isoform X2 [Contarinia nasturtii]